MWQAEVVHQNLEHVVSTLVQVQNLLSSWQVLRVGAISVEKQPPWQASALFPIHLIEAIELLGFKFEEAGLEHEGKMERNIFNSPTLQLSPPLVGVPQTSSPDVAADVEHSSSAPPDDVVVGSGGESPRAGCCCCCCGSVVGLRMACQNNTLQAFTYQTHYIVHFKIFVIIQKKKTNGYDEIE
ncbi:hypothetical protein C0J52_07046 [Blattella germanica]|nr:hypothetical protein C0J52_07046 [Blattella germanica]